MTACNCNANPLDSPIVRRQRAGIAGMRVALGAAPRSISIRTMPPPLGRLGFTRAPRTISIRAMPPPLGRLGFFGAGWESMAAQSAGSAVGTWAGGAVAGAALSAAGAGAIAGSVVPVVGTVIGAAVGYLTSKLFGHANQGQILNDVKTRLQYADEYRSVAGQIPGRVIGIHDLLFVSYGLLHQGIWPGNYAAGVLHDVLCPGTYPKCGNGNEHWVQALFQNTDSASLLVPQIKKANSAGITNPIQIADSYVIPAWDGDHRQSWAAPDHSANPSLVRQLIIDWIDAFEAQSNASLPVYYGKIPGSATAGAPAAPTPPPVTPAGAVMPRVTGPVTVSAPAPIATPAPATPAGQLSANGAKITTQTGGALTTAQGAWTFSTFSATGADEPVLLNGKPTNLNAGQLAILNGTPVALMGDGSTWGWSGSTWSNLSPPTAQPIVSSANGSLMPALPPTAYPAPSYSPAPVDVSVSAPSAPVPAGPAAPTTAGLSSNTLMVAGIGILALSFAMARPVGGKRGARR